MDDFRSQFPNLIQLNDFSVGDITLLREGVETPQYDREDTQIGIVHIGPGFFFRALIAPIMDEVMASGDRNWGISTINLRGTQTKQELDLQDGLYTLVERNGEARARVIGSIMESHAVSAGADAYESAVQRMANPDTKLITMTITEGGYKEENGEPAPAVKLIVDSLLRRYETGTVAPTVMSCDNMPDNGKKLRDAVLSHASQRSSDLKIWIENSVAFPSTMVDRITPSTDADKKANPEIVAAQYGLQDPCAVVSEPYRCWVVENKMSQPGDIPAALNEVSGVILTQDPVPLELTKIRSLNGAHVAVGMIGYLSGHALARDAMQDPNIREFTAGFIDSAILSLPQNSNNEQSKAAKEAYARDVTMSRIANTHLEDQLIRLPRNGSDGKIQNRVVSSAVDLLAKGENYEHHAFVTAVWFEYLKGFDANGNTFDISDKKAIEMGLQTHMRDNPNDIEHILNHPGIFDYGVRNNQEFKAKVSEYYQDIQTLGIKAALAEFNNNQRPAPTPTYAPTPQP